MDGVEIRGAEDFASLGRRIRLHADRKALQKELYAGLNRATKEIRADMKDGIAEALPSGLAAKVAKESGLQTRSRGGGRDVGVRIVTGKKHALPGMERGRLRHPVYGNRATWVDQEIKGGFLEERFQAGSRDARRAIERVMSDVARKVEG